MTVIMGDNYLNDSYFYGFDERQGWNYTTYFSFWNDFHRHDEGMKYVEFCSIVLLSAVSVIVNLTLIIIFIIRKSIRSNQNLYVTVIMIGSVLLLPFSLLIGGTRLSRTGWQFGNTACQLTMYAVVSTAFVKAWLMALISIDRYVKVVRGRDISRKVTVLLVSLSVIIPSVCTGVMSFPNSYTKVIDTSTGEITICTAVFKYHPAVRVSLAYFVTLFVAFFLIPLTVIIVCYSLIMRVIAISTKSLARHLSTSQNKSIKSNNQKRRTTKILVTIVVVSTIMWLPLFCGLAFATLDHVMETFVMSSRVLAWIIAMITLNTLIEPFLYSFTSSRVRKEVWRCLIRRSSRKPSLIEDTRVVTTSVS